MFPIIKKKINLSADIRAVVRRISIEITWSDQVVTTNFIGKRCLIFNINWRYFRYLTIHILLS